LDLERKKEIESFLYEWFNDELFVSVQTSGSTGSPKKIFLSKENMMVSAKKTIDFLSIEMGSGCYLCLSCSTIAGKMMMVRAIMNEMHIIVGPVSSGSLEILNQQVSLTAIVPMQLNQILLHYPDKLQLIRHILVGGAPVNSTLIETLQKEGLTVYQTFGMTETISHVALRRIGYEQDDYYIGLKGIHFSTDDDERLIVHYPEIGLASLQTNDIVELYSKSTFKWLGRFDFAINSGGKKIIPEIIEQKLQYQINRNFFIHGFPDDVLGQKVVLLVEGEPIRDLEKSLDKLLDKFEKPKQILFIPHFVRTKSGKISRLETVKSTNH
jgi:O-succinylbenzoic acid--CoA ligase